MFHLLPQATPEERAKGRSEQELAVLVQAGWSGGAASNLHSGYKHESLGSLDLRTVLTKDGTMTLYDKWNQKYRELKPEETLYPSQCPLFQREHTSTKV